jgi:hypothetical protein
MLALRQKTVRTGVTQDDWNRRAANLLKAELARAGLGYEDLIQKLNEIGIGESYKGISAKINRGTFSFTFFMQCMTAIGIKEIRL